MTQQLEIRIPIDDLEHLMDLHEAAMELYLYESDGWSFHKKSVVQMFLQNSQVTSEHLKKEYIKRHPQPQQQ